MTDPVFASVGQALHVSWLMEVLPVTQKVSTQVLIESIREQLGKVEPRATGSVNTAGMSALEFRGQCAMVRASCRDHLAPPEYDAVRVRYGWQRSKAEGVMSISEYLRSACCVENDWALRAVIWSLYHRRNQRADDRWSYREIERETGVSKSALHRAANVVRERVQALEDRAQSRIGDLFERTGLVESAQYA